MVNPDVFKMTAPLEVGIGCRDLAAMRGFYEGVLGLRFISEGRAPEQTTRNFRLARSAATVVRLQTSYGERIKLIAPDSAPEVPSEHSEYVLDRPNACYLTLIIADVDAAIARLRAAGVQCMTGDQRAESRPGLYVAFLRDPEGNVLELVQYDDIPAYRPDLT